jgi:hypothetical protein
VDVDGLLALQQDLLSTLAAPGAGRPGPAGIDADRLALVARLTHEKRIDKLRSLLPATFAALGERASAYALDFAEQHPPIDAHAVANALQFYRFLSRAQDGPPYLRDVCYCELAMSALGARPAPVPSSVALPAEGAVELRRRPEVRLRRCEHDIRPLLRARGGAADAAIDERAVFLVIARPPGSATGKVFDVEENLFALLSLLRRWHRLSPDDEWLTDETTCGSLTELCALGILQLRPV